MAGISYAHKGVLENRPHDYIYDNTFTVAGRVDHIKQMTRSQAQQVIINPNFENMFSALRHFPPMQFRLKVSPFPQGIGQDRSTVVEPANVAGMNRFKYFKRPLNFVQTFGGQLVLAKKRKIAKKQEMIEPELPTKTIGTQTMYRESEAQTDPYSPDYVFKPDQVPPELIALSSLVYGVGLPAGMAELEMIERARQKRQWELSLPAVVDEESFEKRLKMMEEMELKEWKERELEIKELQEKRLQVLQKVLEKQEQDNDLENDKRVERIWQRKMQEREAYFEKINRKRVKGIRKLHMERQKIDIQSKKRDIIEEYGNFASKVYAPKARDGSFPDNAGKTLRVDVDAISTFQGLVELENSLPKKILEPTIEREDQSAYDKTPEGRKEKQLREQLEMMATKMKERKELATMEKQPLKYAVKIERMGTRPPTPTIEIPTPEVEEMNIAAHILQNLIRGRVAQSRMYHGKQRCLDLINELRARHIINTLAKNDPSVLPNTTANEDVVINGIPTEQINFESAVQAEYVGTTLDFLTKELVRLREERRIAAMVKLADRTRRIREAQESGLRQEELKKQAQQDLVFKNIMDIHQETVDSYLEQVIGDSLKDTASEEAKITVKTYAEQLNELTNDLIAKGNANAINPEYIISDMVTSFLIPYVDKSILREQIERDQKKYLLAAHDAIYGQIEGVESTAAAELKAEAEEEQKRLEKEMESLKVSEEVVVAEGAEEQAANVTDNAEHPIGE